MKRRLLTFVVALGVAMTGSVVSAESAQAATKPKLTFVTVKRAFTSEYCGTFTLSHRKPVLRNSTKANAAKVTATFESALATAQRSWISEYDSYNYQLRLYTGELDCFKPSFSVKTTGSIYQGRYVSLASTWIGGDHSPDGVRTLNLDLKTGKKVKISTFVSNKGNLFSWATCRALMKKADKTLGYGGDQQQYCPDQSPRRALEGWTVSSSGVQVFGLSTWEMVKTTIPWSKLVKANYAKSKKKVTKRVPGKVITNCGTWKFTGTVTVQGNLVTMRHRPSQGVTYYGVKSSGKKSGGAWRVPLTPYGGDPYFHNGDDPQYVYFKSKSSTKPTKLIFYAVCDGP